jgi:uncharacterized SAM-binding protein YcdF (DUF218 family)
MFFLLSKVLSFILSPIIWIFVLLFLSLFSKKPNKKKWFLVSAIILFYFFSNHFIQNEIFRKWEIRPVKAETVKKCDYAIVLGGFSSFDTTVSRMQLTTSGDRIWQAVQLYNLKKVKKIFITGGSGQLLHQDKTEADKVKPALINLGIPESDIIIEAISRNTHENAKNTSEWLKKHDPNATCILVTSAFHMRRAIGCFNKFNINVIPYSSDEKTDSRKFDPDVLLKPNPPSLVLWDALIKEVVGYWIYNIVGYI